MARFLILIVTMIALAHVAVPALQQVELPTAATATANQNAQAQLAALGE